MTVTEEQLQAAVDRVKADRVAAGLTPLIEDESTLRMVAAVFASNIERRRRESTK